MGKWAVIIVLFFIFFAGSFIFFLYSNFSNEITGQIFLENEFERDASDFRSSKDVKHSDVSLSPLDECEIKSISLSHVAIRFEENVSIYVDGIFCIGKDVEVKVFEKDYFFDDYVDSILGKFFKNRAILDWFVSKDFVYLFDEIFEENSLEIYFVVGNGGSTIFKSEVLEVFRDEDGNFDLSPETANFSENREYFANILYWLIFGIMVVGILIFVVLIVRSVRVNSRFNS